MSIETRQIQKKPSQWASVELLLFLSPLIFLTWTFDPAVLPRFLFSFLIVLFASAYALATKQQGIFRSHPVIVLWLLFIAYSSISLLQSLDLPSGILMMGKYVLVLMLIILFRHRFEIDSGFLFSVSRITTYVVLFECIVAALQRFFGAPLFGHDIEPKFLGTLTHENEFSSYLLYTLPLVIFHAFKSQGFQRSISFLAILAGFFFIVVTKTRSIWLGLIINTAVFLIIILSNKTDASLVLRQAKRWRLPFYIAGGIFIALIATVTVMDKKDFAGHLSLDSSGRLDMWQATMPYIAKNPIWGIGADNWKFTHIARDDSTFNERPHNDYLWIAADHGIPAMALFLAIFVLCFLMGARLSTKGTAEERAAAWVFLSGLITYSIIAFFNFPKERIEHLIYFAFFQAGILYLYGKRFGARPVSGQRSTIPALLSIAGIGMTVFFLFWGVNRCVNESKFKTIYTTRAIPPDEKIELLKNVNQTFYKVDAFTTPIDYHIGMEYLANKNYPEAVLFLEKAYKVNATQMAILNNLAIAYVFTGNQGKALPLYEKVSELYPFNRQAQLNCALIFYQKKDYVNCKRYFAMIDEGQIQNDASLAQRYLLLKKSLAAIAQSAVFSH
jgi:O-antigen ligase